MNSYALRTLTEVEYKNSFVDSLPGDHSFDRRSRTVEQACYSLVLPEAVHTPHLLGWSEALAARFNLRAPVGHDPAVSLLGGNLVLPSMKPFAACYGGHQFGRWAGQLGDGRAITLGELSDSTGQSWELQLKGAGPTPYSRFADGRAVLRSSVREFLASEAMFHLRVPTTRALSLVSTGDRVTRDMFYNGNSRDEAGAIVARMAPCFLRFGNYEIHASRNDRETLKKLVDWTINKYFSFIMGDEIDRYLLWFEEVCRRTAKMIVEWDRVGFVHGVMNTDNMSILGLTIDYGPFGWLDSYDPIWTPNTTDLPGRRYSFGNQAKIALWNLERLAFALSTLVSDPMPFDVGLSAFIGDYNDLSKKMMAQKIGLKEFIDGDQNLMRDLISLFSKAEVDWTIFFRRLYELIANGGTAFQLKEASAVLCKAVYNVPSETFQASLQVWLKNYQHRLQSDEQDPAERVQTMKVTNPKFIPRNYLLFEAIQGLDAGDAKPFENLFYVLRNPYEEHLEFEHLAMKRPDWARSTPGCSTLSCSS